MHALSLLSSARMRQLNRLATKKTIFWGVGFSACRDDQKLARSVNSELVYSIFVLKVH